MRTSRDTQNEIARKGTGLPTEGGTTAAKVITMKGQDNTLLYVGGAVCVAAAFFFMS